MLKFISVLISLFLSANLTSYGQPTSTADSIVWRDTAPKAKHGLATVKMFDGRLVRAYLPTNSIGYENTIDYFRKNPEVRPFPKLAQVSVSELQMVELRGYHLENMHLAGEPNILAMRVVEGPVELFMMSGRLTDNMPILLSVVPIIALPATLAHLGGAAIERNRWFVRRNKEVVAVKRGNFRSQIGEYMADCPTISTQIAEGRVGFRYQDMSQIVQLYNSFLREQATK